MISNKKSICLIIIITIIFAIAIGLKTTRPKNNKDYSDGVFVERNEFYEY